jgi:hypothetical protein
MLWGATNADTTGRGQRGSGQRESGQRQQAEASEQDCFTCQGGNQTAQSGALRRVPT